MKVFVRNQGFSALIGALLMLLIFTIIDFGGWWTRQTITNVLQFTALIGLLAMGEALVIIAREIDLSVGSIYGLSGVAFITLGEKLGVPGAMVAALLIAATIGLLQGLAVVRGGIPSMIVTLCGLFTARGIIYVWTGGTVQAFPKDAQAHWLTRLLGGEFLGLEAAFFWMILVLVILSVAMTRTPFGNRLLATGGDEASAASRGVHTGRVKIAAFVLCALLAGFAGIITLADKPQTHVSIGDMLELEAIAAAVIGGCLLTGGRGSIYGAVLGAFIIISFRYELIALGAPSAWFISFVGAVLIIAVVFNQKLARMAGRNV